MCKETKEISRKNFVETSKNQEANFFKEIPIALLKKTVQWVLYMGGFSEPEIQIGNSDEVFQNLRICFKSKKIKIENFIAQKY